MPIRWPDEWPTNTLKAMRAATFAASIGRAVAFSLAAFRQAFAGGKDLSEVDNVLIAAAACELHPNAVLKAIETQSVKDKLREATREAYDRGVRGVPTIAVGDQLFTATTTSRRPLPPWPRRNVGDVSRRFSRKHGGGAAPLIAAGVAARASPRCWARGAQPESHAG